MKKYVRFAFIPTLRNPQNAPVVEQELKFGNDLIMFCPNCGEPREKGVIFCPYCGIQIEEEKREVTIDEKDKKIQILQSQISHCSSRHRKEDT